MHDLLTEHRDALRIAEHAGTLLCRLRREGSGHDAPGHLGAQADRGSHDLIIVALRASYPDDAVLSEEAADDGTRLSRRRVWIIDPLDGTREFVEKGRDDWAVHVALVIDHVAAAAAVALPAQGVVFGTAPAPLVPPRCAGPLRIVVSRTRPPAFAEPLARRIGGTLLPMGSAGAKTMAVVRGEADVYVHAGGQYEWDSAAPVAVAASAGLHTSRLDGSPVRYNQPRPWLPDQLVCRPELSHDILDALGELL